MGGHALGFAAKRMTQLEMLDLYSKVSSALGSHYIKKFINNSVNNLI
jgi:hypothetical protein